MAADVPALVMTRLPGRDDLAPADLDALPRRAGRDAARDPRRRGPARRARRVPAVGSRRPRRSAARGRTGPTCGGARSRSPARPVPAYAPRPVPSRLPSRQRAVAARPGHRRRRLDAHVRRARPRPTSRTAARISRSCSASTSPTTSRAATGPSTISRGSTSSTSWAGARSTTWRWHDAGRTDITDDDDRRTRPTTSSRPPSNAAPDVARASALLAPARARRTRGRPASAGSRGATSPMVRVSAGTSRATTAPCAAERLGHRPREERRARAAEHERRDRLALRDLDRDVGATDAAASARSRRSRVDVPGGVATSGMPASAATGSRPGRRQLSCRAGTPRRSPGGRARSRRDRRGARGSSASPTSL